MAELLHWGILGTGAIAGKFAKNLATSQTGRLVAVASRDRETVEQFGRDFLPETALTRYASYDDLLADQTVHAVYIATPHPYHARWAIRAALAGKHILCEKPLALNYADAMQIIEAARANRVFLMEAFMYRCHPIIDRLIQILRDGVIHDVRMIHANFGFQCALNFDHRLLNHALGGGAILDVGCYPVSLARLIAGVAAGKDFLDPVAVAASGIIGEKSRVDEMASLLLTFPNRVMAAINTAVQCALNNDVHIYGSGGSIYIPWLWIPQPNDNKIIIRRHGRQPEEINVAAPADVYTLEADVVATAIAQGAQEPGWPAMRWADTLGNMKTLDRWRRIIGLAYDDEKPENRLTPRHGNPLAVRPPNLMPYGRVPGLEKPLSRLIFGVDKISITDFPMVEAMLDDYFQRGGNTFDTAHIYGSGVCERALGAWVSNRAIREQVVIVDKGAHTPDCNPVAVTRQLLESLDRLNTSYVDMYMLHHDNPAVPVDEFVDVLNEQQHAGRIRAFGCSNWSMPRIEAFNTSALSRGLTPFAAISNQFSLARMIHPPKVGGLSSADWEWRTWLENNEIIIMPWSSQARGFFTDRAAPDKTADAELVRCWYSPDNFRRQQRARELGRKLGVTPIAVALAYVLCQPFITFPMIGPATIDETRESFAALQIQLTPEQLRWLNLEA
ncbi:MAG: aldo/keto reductase [Phycisphaerae bacterium]